MAILLVNGVACPAISDVTITRSGGLTSDQIRIPVLRSDLARILGAPKASEVTTVARGDPEPVEQAEALGMAGGRAVITLQIGDRIIHDLRVITVDKSGPGTGKEVVAYLNLRDRRHYWTRRILPAAYNIKRITGIRSATERLSVAPESAIPVLNEFEYRAGTLRDGSLVTVRQAFVEQMEKLDETLGITYFLSDNFGENILAPVEIVDNGPGMLRMLMKQEPEFDLAPMDDGTFNMTRTTETTNTIAALTQGVEIIDGAGQLELVDFSAERPAEIHVYVDIEQELMMIHDEDHDESIGITRDRDPADFAGPEKYSGVSPLHPNMPYLEGVINNPLRDLKLGSQLFAEGSWMRCLDYFQALQDNIKLPEANTFGHLTYKLLRQMYLRPWELEGQFLMPTSIRDDQWVRIYRAIKHHWRRSFKLNRFWWDRIRGWRANRAGIINPFDLTRAQSPVFTPHTLWPSRRMYTQTDLTVYNQHGFLVRMDFKDPAKQKKTPGVVKILPGGAGVIQMSLKPGSYGEEERIIPGTPVVLNSYADFTGLHVGLRAGYRLETEWGFTTIMTAMPYYRQDKSFMHKIVVTPEQAQTRLKEKIGVCTGPVLEIKLPFTELLSARFRWDNDAPEKCIDPFLEPGVDFAAELLTNSVMITDVAIAAAAVEFSSRMDRIVGAGIYAGVAPPDIEGSIRNNVSIIDGEHGVIRHAAVARQEFPRRTIRSLTSTETQAALLKLKMT